MLRWTRLHMGGQCGQPTVLYMYRVYPMSTKQSISKDSHTGKCDQKGCKLQCKDVIGKKVKTQVCSPSDCSDFVHAASSVPLSLSKLGLCFMFIVGNISYKSMKKNREARKSGKLSWELSLKRKKTKKKMIKIQCFHSLLDKKKLF